MGVRRLLFALLVAGLVPGAARAEPAHVGYPSSIAILGDSGSTGYNSATPARDAKENSWATGTNPAVDSIYQRLLALNPRIRGRNANWAKDGASAADMLGQAQSALSTHPDLVLMQIGGNDFCGDHDTPIPTFRGQIVRALTVLSHGLPNARLFVTSIPFSAQYLQAIAAIPVAREANSPGGPCDPNWDANGNPDPQRLAHINGLLAQYDGALTAACAQFVHCRYDGGAEGSLIAVPEDFSSDWGHNSVAGLTKVAAGAWPALFDFTDTTAPTSTASVRGTHGVRIVTLTAHDGAGVAGIEFKLGANKVWTRYRSPVHLPPKAALTWRAADVNGNIEATHTLKAAH